MFVVSSCCRLCNWFLSLVFCICKRPETVQSNGLSNLSSSLQAAHLFREDLARTSSFVPVPMLAVDLEGKLVHWNNKVLSFLILADLGPCFPQSRACAALLMFP